MRRGLLLHQRINFLDTDYKLRCGMDYLYIYKDDLEWVSSDSQFGLTGLAKVFLGLNY
jgi:hypothetical protein